MKYSHQAQSLEEKKQYFGLNQFLGGTSTAAILSVARTEPPSVIRSYNCSIPGFNDWKAVFQVGPIVGLEAELNGSDPICWSSLLELATHLLLAHRDEGG